MQLISLHQSNISYIKTPRKQKQNAIVTSLQNLFNHNCPQSALPNQKHVFEPRLFQFQMSHEKV